PSLSPSQRATMKANGWLVAATSHLLRNADGTFAPDPSRPWVVARVFGLSQQGHDILSNDVMENFITDLTKVPSDQYTLFGKQDVVYDGGFHGILRYYERAEADGTYSRHLEQVVTNPQTSVLYTLSIECSTDCFQDYGRDIDAVLGSWTIKEP